MATADPPSRPVFTDGQPLGAADLELIVDGARNHAARHERGAHTPGIVTGLELRTQDDVRGGVPVTTITITAGIAVDAAGRQVVLAADEPLPPEQFDSDGGSRDPDPSIPGGRTTYPHPVFLTLDERDAQASAFGVCGEPGGGGRVVDDHQVRIGRRGEHLDLTGLVAPGPGDELGSIARTYRILLGFVRANSAGWADVIPEMDNVRASRAGVRAAEVITPGDRLALRAGDPLAAGQPVLVVDTAQDGSLLFGRTSATGGVDEVFTVTANGDVIITGRLFPQPEAGTLWMYSAVVTDGMPLVLPSGVDPDEIAHDRISVHTTITPHYPADGSSAFLVGRCEVDADRVVHCVLHRVDTTAAVSITPVPVAAANVTVTAVLKPPDRPGGGS